MNTTVLMLAAIGGLVAGLLLYWLRRNVLAAVCCPLVAIGSVCALLPWNLEPVEPDPTASVPQVVVPESTKVSLTDEAFRPIEVTADGYTGSDACRECHAENHQTWYASYHRTMTQIATPKAVLGDFNNVHLSFGGYDYLLQDDGETCWVDMPNPTVGGQNVPKRTLVPIVMTTGSHHMQAYWFPLGHGRVTGILPWVFLNETQEWVPRSAAFVQAHVDMSYELGRWSEACSKCHSTHRRERYRGDIGTWDTKVAEFGISCEACHGPAQQHIEFHQASKQKKETSESLKDLVDPIVNPATLGKEKSSQVCGQCHSVMSLKGDLDTLNQTGHAFRPGRDLNETHTIMQRDLPAQHALLDPNLDVDLQLDQWYYRDGMVRLAGREYTGLIDSACYKQGEMTCLTCHQMHKLESDPRPLKEWADDQLRPDALGDSTCVKCHSADQYGQSHTHHVVGSSGSSCYNCHMPHTSYGLLKAIRSHTISSPDVGKDLAARRPNACNLCHLDKTLEWSADKLSDWYGIEPPELNSDQREVAASLLSILTGNAAERAVVAWHMGWTVAQQTSGTAWQTPFLAQLLDDPYLAIRLIARRSLRTLDGLGDLQVDVFASFQHRRAGISSIANHWYENVSETSIQRTEVLFGKDGIQVDRVGRLMQLRDDSPIYLAE